MIRHYTLTLNGSAQRLSSVLPDALADGRHDRPVRTISLQPHGGNGNEVYVGAAAVSSSNFGVRLEAGATGVPPAPFVLGEYAPGWCKLSDFYVIGTDTQKLQLLVDFYA